MIRFRHRISVLLAAVLVAAVYAAGSWSNQFVYDDHEVIENQFPIRTWNDVVEVFRRPHYLDFPYYRPMTRLTFVLQKTISGNRPRPYHLLNAALAGLVMLAAYALLRRPALALAPTAALLVAAWFALHPAMSECVYPAASGRESLLPALAILLATWAYLGRGIVMYFLAIALLAVALLCKEQAAVLPAIFILIDFLDLRSASHAKLSRRLWRCVPAFAILAAYFLLRHYVFQKPTLHIEIQHHPLDALKSLLYGVQTAITPFVDLHYEPTFPVWFDWRLSAISLVLLTTIALLIARAGRPPRLAALFWLAWFILLQLPTAHVFRQEAPYSERYVALAILAVPATIAAVLHRPTAPLRRIATIAISLGWIALFAWLSFLRSFYYTDDTSFALHWLDTNPDSAGAHNGLGLAAQLQNRPATAISEYRQALDLDPDSATAHNNLANLLAAQGRYTQAAMHYQWLLQQNPRDVSALVNYAQMLGEQAFAQRDPALRARSHDLLMRAIALRPRYAQAHYILGVWDETFATRDAAIAEFQTALSLRPDLTEVRRRLDALLAMKPLTRPTTIPVSP